MDSVTVRLYGSNGSEIFIKTDKEGTYRQKLMPNVDYIYVVVKKGYLVNKGKVSTKDLDYNKTFTDSIYMSAIDKPIEIPNVYYDFGKWKLKEDSKIELDKLVKLLNDNPNIIIELSSYTDMVGDSASNMVLSQKRANSVVEYLISKGIPKGRLKAKGYGKSVPKRILTDKLAKQTGFVKGTVLSEDFINSLDDKDKKDLANQLNRRTEIKVIGTDYMPDF
jgi:peptidoglycan-associated lipoprotein